MKKVMVGMSGGVDSSVAAMLLRDKGYEVMGVTLKLFSDEDISEAKKEGKTCCALSDVEDARSVAIRLGFEHLVFNFREFFREHVMQQFAASYLSGRTPNPCIECNRHVKFDKMLRRALELDYGYIATGHYAVNEYDESRGRWLLKRKDQSPFDTIFKVLRLTVIGLIAAAALSLVTTDTFGEPEVSLHFIASVVIFVSVFILSFWRKVSPILLIVVSGAAGLILY